MSIDDAILAVSSPQANDGVRAIVRVSGPGARDLARGVTDLPEDVATRWRAVRVLPSAGGGVNGAILFFKGPRSYTGQDVAELHLPNSPALVALVLDELLRVGRTMNIPARMAEPGEFTARAFFNGKMDLTQAEGIAATINAGNQTQLRAATRLRAGDLHRWLAALADDLGNLLALVEAGIDFSDEEAVEPISRQRLTESLRSLGDRIHAQMTAAVRIDRLALPPTIVFVGKPNVGKSSLINALAEFERSIVSPVAGTTRDLLAVTIQTPRGDIRLVDVPGEELPRDELTGNMMAARQNALLDADLIVEVLDDPAAIGSPEVDVPHVIVWNKADLIGPVAGAATWQVVSAKTGHAIPDLRTELTRQIAHRCVEQTAGSTRLVLNHRHRELLLLAAHRLHTTADLVPHLTRHPELIASEMRLALDLLGQITGTISPDEVLGRVFSQFCIGK